MLQEFDSIKVDVNPKPYNIYFNNGFMGLDALLYKYNYSDYSKIGIITDSNVDKLYSQNIYSELIRHTNICKFVFEAGEESKTINTVSKIYDFLIEERFDRDSLLIALGGGVVGDLTGFVASTYMRGMNYIQIPTTLLAQIDSSIGGKTGFNYSKNKNMIGTFCQPHFIYVNTNTLNTLPIKEFENGMAEAIKHGFIMDKDYLSYIEHNKEKIKKLCTKELTYLVKESCKIKSSVVSQDVKEKGLRKILNFGHTIGHAIESLYNYKFSHGECIALGMISSLYLSYRYDFITQDDIHKAEHILKLYNLPVKLGSLDVENVYNKLFYDKKIKQGHLCFILIESIGHAVTKSNLDGDIIKECINYIKG